MDEVLLKNTLAYSIKKHRKKKGLSQQMLAEISGISPKFLSKVECAKCCAPSIITVMKLAKGLGKSVSELLEPEFIPNKKSVHIERINFLLNERVSDESHLCNIAMVLEIIFDNKEGA